MSEVWKDVVGYEGLYEISDLGRVRSVLRLDLYGHKRGGHMMKIGSHGQSGYPIVKLSRAGKKQLKYIHALILEAFVGPKPNGMEALHSDDIRTNSVLSNLRWGTRVENFEDRDRNGRTARGSRNGKTILDETQVAEIKRRLRAGLEKGTEIAASFGVSKATIYDIRNDRVWSHVQ